MLLERENYWARYSDLYLSYANRCDKFKLPKGSLNETERYF